MKGFHLEEFETIPEDELNGVIVSIGEDASVRVARMNNKNYMKLSKRLMKPLRGMLQREAVPEDTQDDINCELIASTILLGWEGLMIEGEIVPYSKEKAKEILLDPKWRNFSDMIVRLASSPATFKALDEEELVKN